MDRWFVIRTLSSRLQVLQASGKEGSGCRRLMPRVPLMGGVFVALVVHSA